MSEYILEMRDIKKQFGHVKVLHGVTLQIKPGEVHALMGENGAGKSTLMKILMGIYTADAGEILLNDQNIAFKNPREAMDHGISMIHQELNSLYDMPVYENIFIGREKRTALGLVDKKGMIQETQTLLRSMNIDLNPMTHMRDLSVAQCQLVEIVKAISVGAQVIIMDEPTSAITDREIDALFEQIDHLKKQNVAIIYISHKMDEIFQICDRITVLRDGVWIGTDQAQELDHESLIKMMVGRDITEVFPKTTTQIGETILEVTDIRQGKKVKGVSFSLRRGEILGIAGLVGAGRSELVESIFGITPREGGQIKVHGQEVRIRSPRDAIRQHIALITEDRKLSGLNLEANITENISIVAIDKVSPRGVISQKNENQVADEYIEKLKIKAYGREQEAVTLSGGNQQKVVLSKWLFSQPEIIILDEPTRGIDVGAKRDIYLLIGELTQQGKAVIVISSEIPELMGVCDRIIVMAEGRLTGEIDREHFSQERIMTYAAKFGDNQNERFEND